jgi:large subunit ribosomal protein L15
VNAEKATPVVVNLAKLESALDTGATVSPKTLVVAGVVPTVRKKAPIVKILGSGSLTKKFTVENCQVSKSAAEKIVAAGGSVK